MSQPAIMDAFGELPDSHRRAGRRHDQSCKSFHFFSLSLPHFGSSRFATIQQRDWTSTGYTSVPHAQNYQLSIQNYYLLSHARGLK